MKGTAVAEEGAKPVGKPKKKAKAVRSVPHGCAYVQATFNNTIITITDLNGNTLAWASSGGCGFRGPKKATPYAAGVIVKAVADKIKDYGMRDLSVFLKGVGSGRDSAVRALNANLFNVLSIKDLTPLPHNGCRPRRARRV
ncbi:30S ribosomal protein S11 [Patescibacteria group bacterium]|nr:MAG: 30S ribosomal protein S11 [Patescibacteria group bacterium]